MSGFQNPRQLPAKAGAAMRSTPAVEVPPAAPLLEQVQQTPKDVQLGPTLPLEQETEAP